MYSIHTEFIKEISFHFQLNNIFNVEYESNAWVYRFVSGGQEGMLDGYFPQAPIKSIKVASVTTETPKSFE